MEWPAGSRRSQASQTLTERLLEVVGTGLLTASTDTTECAAASGPVVIVVVPLVVDPAGQPDFAAIDAATAAVAAGLTAGTLVSYETTLPVHTTRRRLAPALAARSGLWPGADFSLVPQPRAGVQRACLRRPAPLPETGGRHRRSERNGGHPVLRVGAGLRPPAGPGPGPNGVWDLGSAEAAELTKLAETTYRDVNIALANEFARFAGTAGLDVYEVIEASTAGDFAWSSTSPVSRWAAIASRSTRGCTWPVTRPAGVPAVARQVNEDVPGGDRWPGFPVPGRPGRAAGGRARRRVPGGREGGVGLRRLRGRPDDSPARGASPVVPGPLFSAAELGQFELAGFFHLRDP